jgi:hypothetical protein
MLQLRPPLSQVQSLCALSWSFPHALPTWILLVLLPNPCSSYEILFRPGSLQVPCPAPHQLPPDLLAPKLLTFCLSRCCCSREVPRPTRLHLPLVSTWVWRFSPCRALCCSLGRMRGGGRGRLAVGKLTSVGSDRPGCCEPAAQVGHRNCRNSNQLSQDPRRPSGSCCRAWLHPVVPGCWRDCSRIPWIPESLDAPVPYIKWHIFAYDLHTVGISR